MPERPGWTCLTCGRDFAHYPRHHYAPDMARTAQCDRVTCVGIPVEKSVRPREEATDA